MKIGGGQASTKKTKKKQKKSNSKILKPLPNPSAESKSTIRSYSSLSSLSPSSDQPSKFDIPLLPPGFNFEDYANSNPIELRGRASPPIPIPITTTGLDRRARIESEERRKRERRKRQHNAATKLQAVQRGVRARNLAKGFPLDTKSQRKKELLYPIRPLIPPGTYAAEENLDDPDGFDDHGHTSNKKGPAEWVAHELRRNSSWSKGGKRRKTKRRKSKRRRKTKRRKTKQRRKSKRRRKSSFSKTKRRKK